jgi:hypothetical protein
MTKKRSLVSNIDRSVAGSFGSDFEDHQSLDANHKQAPEAHASSLDAGSSSAMLTCREGVRSEYDVYTRKYIAQ